MARLQNIFAMLGLVIVLSFASVNASHAGLFNFDFTVHIHSGTTEDPYVEEPLVSAVKKYETALQTSNNVLELLQNGDYQTMYDVYASDLFKSISSADDVFKYHANYLSGFGAIKAFKPMQWDFKTESAHGRKMLVSRKIVEHERGMFVYVLSFLRDTDYDKIVGFSITTFKQ